MMCSPCVSFVIPGRDAQRRSDTELAIPSVSNITHWGSFPGMTKRRIRNDGLLSFVKIIVPLAANMPPTPWQTEIFASLTCAGAMPRICRTLSCSAYMPYMPECM